MNLCVDRGNTLVKLAVFEGERLVYESGAEKLSEEQLTLVLDRFPVKHCIASSTAVLPGFLAASCGQRGIGFLELSHLTPLPFRNAYKTPATLGKDRLAGVAGAMTLKPATDVLVVDAGTAITFDFLDADGVYRGGNIAPGVAMRARALHEFTSRLPLIDLYTPGELLGDDTRSAINNGVVYGAVFEIDGYIDSLVLKYPKLSTFLTGGSSFYFDNKLKNRTFAVKNLVLTGLNRILNFNVQ
ncbi:MAG: pantothenate kinase [Paludibacter sp. 47-17]|nr:MAG: pantothenate kinase [Paludibacter sp. 47-17]